MPTMFGEAWRPAARGAWRVPVVLLCSLAASTFVAAADPLQTITLADLADGRVRLVDLSYPLNERTNYWPGEQYEPFRLRTIATLERDGVLSKAVSFPEHIGTHVDAPNHFAANQSDVASLPPERWIGRGVVLDISGRAESDADALLTVEDVQRWEERHGRIPAGAIVLLHTGWGRYWDRPPLYHGRDTLGRLHFPSYSPEAARLLIEERQAQALGVDTLSIDPGVSQKFEVHHIVNGAGRYGIENLTGLEQLPPTGFVVSIAPIKVEGGTGGPARVLAIVPQ